MSAAMMKKLDQVDGQNNVLLNAMKIAKLNGATDSAIQAKQKVLTQLKKISATLSDNQTLLDAVKNDSKSQSIQGHAKSAVAFRGKPRTPGFTGHSVQEKPRHENGKSLG